MYLFPPQIDHFIKDNTSPVQTKVPFPIFAMFSDHEAPLAVTSLPWQPFKTVPRHSTKRLPKIASICGILSEKKYDAKSFEDHPI